MGGVEIGMEMAPTHAGLLRFNFSPFAIANTTISHESTTKCKIEFRRKEVCVEFRRKVQVVLL